MHNYHNEITKILDQALALPVDQRAGFLTEACAGNDQLLKEATSILAAYESSGDFLDGVAELDWRERDDAWLGRTVDKYKLDHRIGTGGMGDVYLATRSEGDFDQRVAIKLIRRGALDSSALRRFRNECRVLAMLDHPGIARMIDGGTTDDGTPYIVMEHVDGIPIHHYCTQHHLTVRDRLDLVVDVCEALRAVHRHSTIHRDVKPGNILVTAAGQPKLVDFGIARVLDIAEDNDTVTGVRALTPTYASPEQLVGEPLSTTTDVYSLGVVAYELLVGRVPFADVPRSQLTSVVPHTVPTRPSEVAAESANHALARELNGDLDTIVLMALRAEPERRYQSIERLQTDIQNYLRGLPVSAQPDTFRYRAGKFARRNVAAVTSAGILLVTMIVATIVSLTLYSRAEEQRRLAEARQQQLQDEVDKSQATTQFLQNMLASADPGASGRDVRVADLLQPALSFATTQYKSRPQLNAQIHDVVATTYAGLGLFSEAVPVYERALSIRRSINGENHPETWWAMAQLGSVVADVEDFTRADSLLSLAHHGLIATYGPDHDRTLTCQTNYALLLTYSGKLEDAELLTKDALHRRRHQSGDLDRQTLTLENNLALVYLRQDRYADAEPLLASSVSRLEQVLGTNHPDVLVAYSNLVTLYVQTQRLDEAERYARRALESQREILGPSHYDALAALNNLAYIQNAKGDVESASRSYAEALSLALASIPDNELFLAIVRGNYGETLSKLAEFENATPLLHESLRTFGRLLGENDPRTQRAIGRLVSHHLAQNDSTAAAIWQSRLANE